MRAETTTGYNLVCRKSAVGHVARIEPPCGGGIKTVVEMCGVPYVRPSWISLKVALKKKKNEELGIHRALKGRHTGVLISKGQKRYAQSTNETKLMSCYFLSIFLEQTFLYFFF